MEVLILFSFLSGIFTLMAPCVWPLIPIVFASAVKSRQKSLGIVLGLSASFFLVTLSIASAFRLLHISNEAKQILSSLTIGLLGIILLLPKLSEQLETQLSIWLNKAGIQATQYPEKGLRRGLITGFTLGFVWSPCASPIIAAVIAMAVARQNFLQAATLALVYVIGFMLPLLLITLLGAEVLAKTRMLNKFTERIQQFFGALLLILALLMFTGLDKNIFSKFLDSYPAYSMAYSKIYKLLDGHEAIKEQVQELASKK
jgi:cytochrome c-type biogenesis protein